MNGGGKAKLIFVSKRKGNIERRSDYLTLIEAGYPVGTARRLRDWTFNHIVLYLQEGPKFDSC